jgi:hypothetical protein
LIKHTSIVAWKLTGKLGQRGILVRDCSSFPDIGNRYVADCRAHAEGEQSPRAGAQRAPHCMTFPPKNILQKYHLCDRVKLNLMKIRRILRVAGEKQLILLPENVLICPRISNTQTSEQGRAFHSRNACSRSAG